MNTRKAPLESVVKKKILDALRSRGAYVNKTHGSPLVTRGLPDITGCYRGYYIAFEVKRDQAGKPTELQVFNIRQIRKADGHAWVIWSVDQALIGLRRIDKEIAQKEGASPGGGNPTKPRTSRRTRPTSSLGRPRLPA